MTNQSLPFTSDSYVQRTEADITPDQALRACAEYVISCVRSGALVCNTTAAHEAIDALDAACSGVMGAVKPLTPAQSRVYVWVRDFIYKNGYSPSYEEIAEAMGLASKSNVHRYLYEIQQRGWINISPLKSRSIQLVKEQKT
jgi:hypothetical protein